MTSRTIALALAVASLSAMPALACSGAKKGGMEQSSITAPTPDSPIIKQIKGTS